MTGGWAAKELTELGLRTLVLDAGRPLVPARTTPNTAGVGDAVPRARRSPLRRESPADAAALGLVRRVEPSFWVDDVDNPYTTPQDKPFDWFRSRQVGGKSTIWGRQVYRWSDLDFEANVRDGIAVDWPIRYADLAPWYDHVESFIGVSGQREGLAHLPDGPFLPPMAMNCVEQHVAERIRASFPGERLMTIGRAAVLTAPLNGRAACHYCGPCHRGCITRSYFSALNATLPAAEATGRMTLRPYSVVRHLTVDPSTGKVSGVHVIDAQTRASLEFRRASSSCARRPSRAPHPAQLPTAQHPDGLANSSDQVGRNVMDHIKWGGATGQFDGWADAASSGPGPTASTCRASATSARAHPDFVRGYGFQGGGSRRAGKRVSRRPASASRSSKR